MVSGSSALSPMLAKLEQWSDLDAVEREAVLRLPHSLERVGRFGHIVREGDKATHSCLIRSGFACRQKTTGEGARSISAIHIKGDMVDLQNSLLGAADHSVQALTACEIAFIPREAILEVAGKFARIGFAMWYDTLVDGSVFREWLLNVSRREASARIGHLLCELGIRIERAGLGSRDRFELPITQEQIADATGLTTVHVNRTLKRLNHAGLINQDGRSIHISDWSAMEAAADFSSAYLHLDGADGSKQ